MSKIAFFTLIGICVCCFLMAMVLSPRHARAHDYWSDGRKVDPQTKNLCCSGADTKVIDEALVKLATGGVKLQDTGEFIATERIQPAPDNQYWVSRWGGSTKCFFAPYSF